MALTGEAKVLDKCGVCHTVRWDRETTCLTCGLCLYVGKCPSCSKEEEESAIQSHYKVHCYVCRSNYHRTSEHICWICDKKTRHTMHNCPRRCKDCLDDNYMHNEEYCTLSEVAPICCSVCRTKWYENYYKYI